MQQLTISILANDNWRPFYKPLAKALKDNDPAIMLGELANSYDYFRKKGELKNGWFFYNVKRMEEETNLSKYKQQQAIKKLVEAGLISVQKSGMPAQRWFTFPVNFANRLANFVEIANQSANHSPTGRRIVRQHEGEQLASKETLIKETLKDKPAPEKKAVNLEGIKNEILGLEINSDSVPNRIEIWKRLEPYLETSEFKNQWEFVTMGIDKLPAKEVLQTWVVKAPYFQVKTLKINKIRPWVETQIRINKKNNNGKPRINQKDPASNNQSSQRNGAPASHSGNPNSWF